VNSKSFSYQTLLDVNSYTELYIKYKWRRNYNKSNHLFGETLCLSTNERVSLLHLLFCVPHGQLK